MADYYVDAAADPGPGAGTIGDPWDEISSAANNPLLAGDRVYVKNGTYEEQDASTNAILFLDTVGTVAAPINWEGYTSTPGDGGTVGGVILDCSTNTLDRVVDNGSDYNVFKGFTFTNAAGIGFNTATSDNQLFVNCVFSNCGGNPYSGDNNISFVNCMFSGNAGNILVDNECIFVGCVFHSNTGSAQVVDTEITCSFAHCLWYNNTNASALRLLDIGNRGFLVVNCTMDGDDDQSVGAITGMSVVTTALGNHVIANCVVYDCNTAITAPTLAGIAFEDYNCLNSNSGGDTSTNFSTISAANNITTAPGFENEASDNYTPGSSSNLLQIGIDAANAVNANETSSAVDIGAIQLLPTGGAGGLVLPLVRKGLVG